MKKIAVFGGGKMARQVAEAAAGSEQLHLIALIARNQPPWLDDAIHLSSLEQITELPDLLIDFTLSGGTFEAAHWCRSRLVPLVSGTTGLSNADRTALFEASELVPVMWAPNLSKGLNLLMKSVVDAAAALPDDTPVEILDVHHAHKKDVPSGTALLLAQAIANARDVELDDCLDVVVDGTVFTPARGRITCISRREGDAVGEHHVCFRTGSEDLKFAHVTSDRSIYALGSLEAGLWLIRQPAGLYTSTDWLSA